MDRLNSKIPHKLDAILIINVNILLNVHIDIVKSVHTNKLRNADNYIINDYDIRFMAGFHYLEEIIDLGLSQCFLGVLGSYFKNGDVPFENLRVEIFEQGVNNFLTVNQFHQVWNRKHN